MPVKVVPFSYLGPGRYSVWDGTYDAPTESIPQDCKRIQWSHPLKDHEAKSLGELLKDRPDINLSAMYRAASDLSWLGHLEGHQSFDFFFLEGCDPSHLRHIPRSTAELSLRGFTSNHSLRLLDHLHHLETCQVEDVQRGFEALTEMPSLSNLMVRSARKLDATLFAHMPRLRSLDMKLGSLVNPDAIGDCRHLKYLEIWMSRGLTTIAFVSRLKTLQYLFLQSLGQVDTLPDFSRLTDLRRVWIQGLHGITDLTVLTRCRRLEELAVFDCRGLVPDSFRPLGKIRTLRRFLVSHGGLKRSRMIREMVGAEDGSFSKWDFEFE